MNNEGEYYFLDRLHPALLKVAICKYYLKFLYTPIIIASLAKWVMLLKFNSQLGIPGILKVCSINHLKGNVYAFLINSK